MTNGSSMAYAENKTINTFSLVSGILCNISRDEYSKFSYDYVKNYPDNEQNYKKLTFIDIEDSKLTKETTYNFNSIDKSLNHNQNLSLLKFISLVNSSQLKKYISNIQSFGPHPTGSSSIENVKTYLFNKFSNMSLNVSYHAWDYEDRYGENIIATLPGKSSPENIIIICAHYDTVAISPGADDDGSGIAAVLMIASILCNYSFNSTIKFILFSGEEQGCLGSLRYATEAKEQKINIIGVLALDKIGYATTSQQGKIIRHHANPASSWMIDLTENLSKQYMNEINLKVQRFPYDASSDHKSFIKHGYTGSNLVESSLNPYYHTSEDTLEHMNITYLTKVCQLAICTLATIAQGNSNLKNEDITISIQGKHNNPYQARLTIYIQNKKYPIDTANLSITIEMNHLYRGTPVMMKKEYYSIPCIWQFIEELEQEWYFHLGPQTYTIGFFNIVVSVHGINDDFPITRTCSTVGLIFPSNNLLIISTI